MRAAGGCHQSIQWIPFKRARAIAGKIPVEIIDESFTSAPGDSHIVAIRRGISVHIGRSHRDRIMNPQSLTRPGYVGRVHDAPSTLAPLLK